MLKVSWGRESQVGPGLNTVKVHILELEQIDTAVFFLVLHRAISCLADVLRSRLPHHRNTGAARCFWNGPVNRHNAPVGLTMNVKGILTAHTLPNIHKVYIFNLNFCNI